MNSKVDMVHQMHTSGNLQEESFSGSWVHDILNSHRSSSGEVLNWMPNFCEQIAPEYWSTSKWELAHFTVHNYFIIFLLLIMPYKLLFVQNILFSNPPGCAFHFSVKFPKWDYHLQQVLNQGREYIYRFTTKS